MASLLSSCSFCSASRNSACGGSYRTTLYSLEGSEKDWEESTKTASLVWDRLYSHQVNAI
jgi:hypothetical protein